MKDYHLTKDEYALVKQSVSMKSVVSYYGISIKRGDTIQCPFHNDKYPSVKLYDHSYYCWSCGAAGDVIGFVARYNGINNEMAAKTLIEAFNLPIKAPSSYKEDRLRRQSIKEQQELLNLQKKALIYAKTYLYLLIDSLREKDVHYDEAIQELEKTEYFIEVLDDLKSIKQNKKEVMKKSERLRHRIIGWHESPG